MKPDNVKDSNKEIQPKQAGTLASFFGFIWRNKFWWLWPIALVVSCLLLLLALTGKDSILPSIYALF